MIEILLLVMFCDALESPGLLRLKQALCNFQAIFHWPGCFKIEADRDASKGNHQLVSAVGDTEMELLLRRGKRWFAVAIDADIDRIRLEMKVLCQHSA